MDIVHDGLEQGVFFITHLPERRPYILESSTFYHDTFDPDLLEKPFDVGHLHDDPDTPRQCP